VIPITGKIPKKERLEKDWTPKGYTKRINKVIRAAIQNYPDGFVIVNFSF